MQHNPKIDEIIERIVRYQDYASIAPVIPIAVFTGVIMLSVGLAYYSSGRKICSADILEGLKDDTM